MRAILLAVLLTGCVAHSPTISDCGDTCDGGNIDGFTGECLLPTSDTGKTCRGPEDCEGFCTEDSLSLGPDGIELRGTCSSYKRPVLKEPNCDSHVVDGKSRASDCVN
jgi:hypothetical protein